MNHIEYFSRQAELVERGLQKSIFRFASKLQFAIAEIASKSNFNLNLPVQAGLWTLIIGTGTSKPIRTNYQIHSSMHTIQWTCFSDVSVHILARNALYWL